ncbi:MAG: hypothetical protein M3O33_08455, partial [Cyanobacteriota bacterium]|nr:hypothetical protein [Cyanobacteriota bacterium]
NLLILLETQVNTNTVVVTYWLPFSIVGVLRSQKRQGSHLKDFCRTSICDCELVDILTSLKVR